MLALRWRNWLNSFDRECRRHARRPRFRPWLECLEDRWAPAVFTVTNTLDNGAGSLRQAILDANGNAGLDTIEFAIATSDAGFQNKGGAGFDPGDYWSIQLQSALPTITGAVIIDGWTQSGFSDRPIIELDGSLAGGHGLHILAGGSTVRGLIINQFSGDGIRLGSSGSGSGADGNLIQGNYIGTDAAGSATLGFGNGQAGIQVFSSGNTIGGVKAGDGNVISGNGTLGLSNHSGIDISGGDRNLIQGNFIGTNAAGTAALGNFAHGIHVGGTTAESASSNNTIGGAVAGARNIISGNGRVVANFPDGIEIERGDFNLIQGNYIGTDVTGTVDLGNRRAGVQLISNHNTVSGNLISGNDAFGIFLNDQNESDVSGNLIVGNRIGTDAAGTAALGNGLGIQLAQGAKSNTIGGTTEAARNIISGNVGDGILFGDPSGVSAGGQNVVRGNFIGTDATGTANLGNGGHGIRLVENSDNQTIGGAVAGAGNVISGNKLAGVSIEDSFNGILIQGNYIGTDVLGTANLGNTRSGVEIVNAGANTIGGTTALARNIIAGNGGNGVLIDRGFQNRITGNYIGTDASGQQALPNAEDGVRLSQAENNTIGGAQAGARNIISGNQGNGVVIEGSGEVGNLVIGNFIGTDRTGTNKLGNFLDGVVIRDGAQGNTIGGNTRPSLAGGLGNVIAGNNFGDPDGGTVGGTGVVITGADTQGNVVQGNFIGVDVTGNRPLANQGDGVAISDRAFGNTIGGVGARGNVIGANTGNGVGITDQAFDNLVTGNRIGLGVNGTALGNSLSGVAVVDTFSILIGGLGGAQGNIIAYNGANGVTVVNSSDVAILSNSIFENGGLGIDLNDDGVTANDDPDEDGFQNFPVLLSARQGSTVIAGTLLSTPGTTFLLQFFANTNPDPSGHGEGQFFLGSAVATTNDQGLANFLLVFATQFPQGGFLTATATSYFFEGFLFLGGTSEFSGHVLLPPGAGGSPQGDPLVIRQLTPPPDPAFAPDAAGAATLAAFLPFEADGQLLFLRSQFGIQEQTLGGGGGSPFSLVGAAFNGEIGGGLFDDFNGNGRLDPGEPPLVGQIVYLDANDDGVLNDDEWWTITNKRGEYRFQNLPPGRYIVRPVTAYETTVALLNKGYQVKRMPPMLTTAPVTGRQQAELTSQQRSVIDLNFTARVRPDVRPFAPINPTPDKTTPTGPQGRLPRDPEPTAAPRADAREATTADVAERPEPAPSE